MLVMDYQKISSGEATMGNQKRRIATATIYATVEEWANFVRLLEDHDRRHADELTATAKQAVANIHNFRIIKRPANGKAIYQIKTHKALPYLNQLADHVDPEGEEVTLSEIVESLIRGLYTE